MDNKENIYSLDHFLNNDEFIRWIIDSTPELDIQWNKFIKENPQAISNMNRAKEILQSVEMNSYSLSDHEKETIYRNLQHEFSAKKHQRKNRIFYRYAAACVAIISLLGSLFFIYNQSGISPNELMVANDIKIDSTLTNIELITQRSKKVLIEKHPTIQYNSTGKVYVNDQETELTAKGEQADSELNTLIVPNGRRTTLILEDGSKVWVNSGTVLTFPTSFDKENRTISVNGEIYIEVVKDVTRPFYVKTSNFDIRVLGTKFNVSAYNEDASKQVVLVQGSVQIENQQNLRALMHPNELFSLNNGQQSIREVNVYDYISWKDGFLQFSSESLESICQRLSRHYRIKIHCDEESKKQKFSGKLVLFDDFSKVLTTLSDIIPIKYTQAKNEINISINNK